MLRVDSAFHDIGGEGGHCLIHIRIRFSFTDDLLYIFVLRFSRSHNLSFVCLSLDIECFVVFLHLKGSVVFLRGRLLLSNILIPRHRVIVLKFELFDHLPLMTVCARSLGMVDFRKLFVGGIL